MKLFKNKKGVKFTSLLLSILIFLTILIIGLTLYGDTVETYDIDSSEEDILNATIREKMNDTISNFEQTKDDILEQEIESGEDSWYSMLRGAYIVIKSPFTLAGNMFDVLGDIGNAVSRKLGLSPWIFQMGIVALGIIVMGIIIAKVFRFEET